MARNRRAGRWLRGELPTLVSNGVLSAENAEAIERYYERADSHPSKFGFVVLATVGLALIGAGIALLLAHNWGEFSRLTRSIVGFLPLSVAQALVVFALLQPNETPDSSRR